MNIKIEVLRPSKEELIKIIDLDLQNLRFAVRSKNKFEYPEELIKKFKKFLD